MCGILFGFRRGHRVSKALIKRYEKQKSRGTRGFGYIALEKGKIKNVERAEFETGIMATLRDENANEILFHHRTPTSTPNWKETTHPLVVKNKMLAYDYYVIHNGVLQNEDELKEAHEKLGFVYTTAYKEKSILQFLHSTRETETSKEGFNDSEAFAIDLALYLDGHSKHLDSIGTIAFIAFKTDKKGNVKAIIYGHNDGNPLVVEDTTGNKEGMFFIKSEGSGIDVPVDKIYVLDYPSFKVTIIDEKVGRRYRHTPADRTTGFGAHTRPTFPPRLSDGRQPPHDLLPSIQLEDSHRREIENGHPLREDLARTGDSIRSWFKKSQNGKQLEWDEESHPYLNDEDIDESMKQSQYAHYTEQLDRAKDELESVRDDIEVARECSEDKTLDGASRTAWAEEMRKSQKEERRLVDQIDQLEAYVTEMDGNFEPDTI